MREFTGKWWLFGVRAALAATLSAAMFFSQTFLREPLVEVFAIPFVVLMLCLYGVLDGLVVLGIAAGPALPHHSRRVMMLQGTCGIVIGILFATFFFQHANIRWFAALAAIQAGATGIYELVLASHLRRHLSSELKLVGAGLISLVSALVLPLIYDGSAFRVGYWIEIYGLLMAFNFSWLALQIYRFHLQSDDRVLVAKV